MARDESISAKQLAKSALDSHMELVRRLNEIERRLGEAS